MWKLKKKDRIMKIFAILVGILLFSSAIYGTTFFILIISFIDYECNQTKEVITLKVQYEKRPLPLFNLPDKINVTLLIKEKTVYRRLFDLELRKGCTYDIIMLRNRTYIIETCNNRNYSNIMIYSHTRPLEINKVKLYMDSEWFLDKIKVWCTEKEASK